MEFNNSILNQPQAPVGRSSKGPGGKRFGRRPRWLNWISLALLISITLLVGVLIFITSTSKGTNEMDLVDKGKFQAVFLEGGQVYFGKVKSISSESLIIDNIFYLRVSEQGQESKANNQDVSLSRLGCELHGPQDQMVITKSHVSFWENLKDDGQVVKAINEFNKQNPNGQNCSQTPAQQQNTQTQQPSSSTSNQQQTPTNTEQQPAEQTTNP